jgi:osmotically-inducible protein OsmY
MVRRAVLTWLTGLVILVPATLSSAQRSDLQVIRDVQREVSRYSFYNVFDDVNIELERGGVLTLTGSVTQPYKKEDLGRLASSVSGVKEVHNNLKVLPVSQFDDELRYRIARAIYGNSAFWQYAARPDPPIHIIVDRGHVTLTGIVDSEVDRELARALAFQFEAFSVTNELQTTTEARALERALVREIR